MAATERCRKRRKKTYEDDEFAKAAGRMIRAAGRRAQENPDALAFLLDLQEMVKTEITTAGYELANNGQFSLGDLARFMTDNGHKMSRQAAQQRWGASSVVARAARAARERGVAEIINLTKARARAASESVWGDVLPLKRKAG